MKMERRAIWRTSEASPFEMLSVSSILSMAFLLHYSFMAECSRRWSGAHIGNVATYSPGIWVLHDLVTGLDFSIGVLVSCF
jgi:hypothetical protein